MSGLVTRIIGPGRAGQSLCGALQQCGWTVELLDRHADATTALQGADLVVIAVPDASIAAVSAALEPGAGLVIHLSGSRTLDVLAPHARRASLHPLMSLPNGPLGAERLLDSCHFAVNGDPQVHELVMALGGLGFSVNDDDRGSYHAAASVAANHLVALCAQVERIATSIGVPTQAFWKMMSVTLANVQQIGPASALTGPAARQDWDTIAAHLHSIAPEEHELYRALATAAAALAGNDWPSELS